MNSINTKDQTVITYKKKPYITDKNNTYFAKNTYSLRFFLSKRVT